MKIIYVTSSLPYGPGEPFIIPEIMELMRRGHKVMIVPMYPRGGIVHTEGASLLRCTLSRPLLTWDIVCSALVQALSSPRATMDALGSLCREGRPRVRLKNIAVFPKGLWLAKVALTWNADHIHAHWASTTATMALIASMMSGIPWSFTAHRWDIVDDNLLGTKIASAAFIRFISQKSMDMARTRAQCLTKKACVIHVGVSLPASGVISMRSLSSLLDRPFRVLCPGSLIPVKGHRYLIQAMAYLRDKGVSIEILLAGDGELRKALREQARSLGVTRELRFLGQLPHADLMRIYEKGEVDVVVLPSIDLGGGVHEGIPVSLMEAMSYGIPVISTTTGGIPELLGGGAGLLVPERDPLALAEAIEQLAGDPLLRRRLGESGRRKVREEFSVEKVVDELIRRFQSGRGDV